MAGPLLKRQSTNPILAGPLPAGRSTIQCWWDHFQIHQTTHKHKSQLPPPKMQPKERQVAQILEKVKFLLGSFLAWVLDFPMDCPCPGPKSLTFNLVVSSPTSFSISFFDLMSYLVFDHPSDQSANWLLGILGHFHLLGQIGHHISGHPFFLGLF